MKEKSRNGPNEAQILPLVFLAKRSHFYRSAYIYLKIKSYDEKETAFIIKESSDSTPCRALKDFTLRTGA